MNEESILTSIKKLRGIGEADTSFDADVISEINKTFVRLMQLGIVATSKSFLRSKKKVFSIEDDGAVWGDFSSDVSILNAIQSYIDKKVHLKFDPPLSSTHMESLKQMIAEDEWLLNDLAENTVY